MNNMFGRRYAIRGLSRDRFAAIVSHHAQRHGFHTRKVTSNKGSLIIESSQTAPWYRVLVGTLPQRWLWHIRSRNATDRLEARFDQRCFGWYRIVIAFLLLQLTLLWLDGIPKIHHAYVEWRILHISGVLQFLVGLGIFFALGPLALADGGNRAHKLIEELRQAVAHDGASFEEQGSGLRTRQPWIGVALLAYLAGLGIAVSAKTGWSLTELWSTLWERPGIAILAIVLLIALAGILLVALVLVTLRTAAATRFIPLLPAASLLMGLMFVVGSQAPLFLVGNSSPIVWQQVAASRQPVDTPTDTRRPDAESIDAGATHSGFVGQIRMRVAILLGTLVFMWVMGAWFARQSVGLACATVSTLRRLRSDGRSSSRHEAVSGQGFLRVFRTIGCAMWILTAAILVMGLVTSATLAREVVTSATDTANASTVGPVIGLAEAIRLFFGIDMTSPVPLAVSRMVCGGLASIIPLAMLISLGTWWIARRGDLRRLQSAQIAERRDANTTFEAVLRRRWRLACPDPTPAIVWSSGRAAAAAAHTFGVVRSRKFVELTPPLRDLLEDDEIEALACHELAHHLCGHCVAHNRLQFLARLTLLGSAPVGALEDSFGYELQADEFAVSKFGVEPGVLRSALAKLLVHFTVRGICASADAATSGLAVMPVEGSPAASECATFQTLNAESRLRDRLRTWLRQYTGAVDMMYWHPSIEQRIARLGQRERQDANAGPRVAETGPCAERDDV